MTQQEVSIPYGEGNSEAEVNGKTEEQLLKVSIPYGEGNRRRIDAKSLFTPGCLYQSPMEKVIGSL